MLKVDFHVHTKASGDSKISEQDLVLWAKKRDLDGVALTEHDVLGKGNVEGLLIIPGEEVSTKQGHLIGLGLKKPIPKGMDALLTADKIREQGALVVVPHPMERLRNGLDKRTIEAVQPDAIEVFNSRSFFQNPDKLMKLADYLDAAFLAGSDAHVPEEIGLAYTLVETSERSVEGILEAVRRKKTKPILVRRSGLLLRVKKFF